MRKPREFSLTHKISSLAPGEFFILPDPDQSIDRQLITLRKRSKTLASMNFTASRIKFIEGDRLIPGIKIHRD